MSASAVPGIGFCGSGYLFAVPDDTSPHGGGDQAPRRLVVLVIPGLLILIGVVAIVAYMLARG